MKKASLLVIAAILVSSAAQAMECGAMLDTYSGKIDAYGSVSSAKRAHLRGMAMRGYEACMAGHEFSAKKFFKMLDSEMR